MAREEEVEQKGTLRVIEGQTVVAPFTFKNTNKRNITVYLVGTVVRVHSQDMVAVCLEKETRRWVCEEFGRGFIRINEVYVEGVNIKSLSTVEDEYVLTNSAGKYKNIPVDVVQFLERNQQAIVRVKDNSALAIVPIYSLAKKSGGKLIKFDIR